MQLKHAFTPFCEWLLVPGSHAPNSSIAAVHRYVSLLAIAGMSSRMYGQPLHGVVHLIKREEWEAVQQSEGVGDPKSG